MKEITHIIGAGRSGTAAAKLSALNKNGTGCVFSEKRSDEEILKELSGIGYAWSDRLPDRMGDSRIIVSPGFALDHPWIRKLMAQNATLLSELEWGREALEGQVTAITGSLGKTSMVLLAEALLKDAGYKVTVSGNIGIPVCEIALNSPRADFHVVEVSSFQLEHVKNLMPDRALCLNLVPNHLDRHGTLAEYAGAKARLFEGMTSSQLAVWPEDFPVNLQSRARRIDPREVRLPELVGTRFASGPLRTNLRMLMAVLQGIDGVDAIQQEEVIRAFRFPEHRMQELDIPGAGRVIDDSKSTCLTATKAAMASIPGQVHLVMGGLEKGEDLHQLDALFAERNPNIYLFGASAKKMRAVWKDSVDVCLSFDTLEDALRAVRVRRDREEPLLFSPGCASFDQYSGYTERGHDFRRWVEHLFATFSTTAPL
ncbi:MAG: Mur ligase family protein [Kiritimatiellia bacterium]